MAERTLEATFSKKPLILSKDLSSQSLLISESSVRKVNTCWTSSWLRRLPFRPRLARSGPSSVRLCKKAHDLFSSRLPFLLRPNSYLSRSQRDNGNLLKLIRPKSSRSRWWRELTVSQPLKRNWITSQLSRDLNLHNKDKLFVSLIDLSNFSHRNTYTYCPERRIPKISNESIPEQIRKYRPTNYSQQSTFTRS
jgi:hypothetical protein